MANSADSEVQKPTDLDLHVCKGRTYPGSAGLGLKFEHFNICQCV